MSFGSRPDEKKRIAEFPQNIDRALKLAQHNPNIPSSQRSKAWYKPLTCYAGGPLITDPARRLEKAKKGVFWTADSPRPFAELCELIKEAGVGSMVSSYFGERPAIGYLKCNLRRTYGKDNWG